MLWTHKSVCTALMYTGCESVKCNVLWGCKDSMKPSGPKSVSAKCTNLAGCKGCTKYFGPKLLFQHYSTLLLCTVLPET